jgi:ribonuclease E
LGDCAGADHAGAQSGFFSHTKRSVSQWGGKRRGEEERGEGREGRGERGEGRGKRGKRKIGEREEEEREEGRGKRGKKRGEIFGGKNRMRAYNPQ